MTETAPYKEKYVTYGADKIFRSTRTDVKHMIPDNMSLEHFMFDFKHPTRAPVEGLPWFIDADNGGRIVTRDESKEKSIVLAGAFKDVLGMKPEDVVYFCAPNVIEYPLALWATLHLGGILASGSPVYTPSEMGHQLDTVKKAYNLAAIMTHAATLTPILELARNYGIPDDRIILLQRDTKNIHPESHRFLTVPDLIEQYANKPKIPRAVEFGPGDAKKKVAAIAFSSGTTGLPKGVLLSHYGLIANLIQCSQFSVGRYKAGDRTIAVLPFFHVYGLIVIMHYAIYEGVAIIPRQTFDFRDFLQTIQDYGVTVLWTVPPMLILIAKDPQARKYDLTKIRHTFCGAAPVGQDLVKAYNSVVPTSTILCGFGMTETTAGGCVSPDDDPSPPEGNSGILLNNYDLKIIDPSTGALLGPDQRGELCFRSPATALGYLANPEATAATFDSEGFVHSGDEGYLTRTGWIFITDRIKELIKNRGIQVAPAELEDHLLGHPLVDDVCIVGKYDDYAGELPKAWVVLKPSAVDTIKKDPSSEKDITASICKLVSDHKSKAKHLSGGVEYIDAIPRTPSGKILRRVLRDIEKERYAASQSKL